MLRFSTLALLLSVVGLCCVPWLAAEPLTGKKTALLVGVTFYENKGISALKYTNRDVEQMGEVLKKGGYEVVIMNEERGKQKPELMPTAKNIRLQVQKLVKGKKQDIDDVVLIGLAGHGMQADSRNKKQERKTFTLFCPRDADLTDKVDFTTGEIESFINLQTDIFESLGNCGAKQKVLLVDACREDKEIGSRNLEQGGMKIPPNVVALFSCTNGQFAFETGDLQHGVFFNFVIEALSGKTQNAEGVVRWGRFEEYVCDKVAEYVKKNMGKDGARQTPHAYTNGSGSPVIYSLAKKAIALSEEVRKAIEKRDYYLDAMAKFEGRGDDVDEAGAFKLFEKAAAAGDVKAKAAMAYMLHYGIGRDFDKPKAARMATDIRNDLEQLAENDSEAANWLGLLLFRGVGSEITKKTDQEAAEWFRKAATAKVASTDAMDNLGHCYSEGRGVKQSYKEAADWHKKAAERNLPCALVHYGEMLRLGKGVEKNLKLAFNLFKQAGDRAYPPGIRYAGRMAQFGEVGPKDPAEAKSWFERGVLRGDPGCIFSLGRLYLEGAGSAVPADRTAALELLNRAINLHNREAMGYLGRALITGRGGVTKNEKMARKLFERSGEASRQLYLTGAELYTAGKQRYEEAFSWMTESADAGYPPAMTFLGTMYGNGIGTKRNGDKAIEWWTKAGDNGESEGYFLLGQLHEFGTFGKPNESEARKWYRKAAEAGHEGAKARYEKLNRKG